MATVGASGGVAYGTALVGIPSLLEVEFLENAILFFLRDFGDDFYSGI